MPVMVMSASIYIEAGRSGAGVAAPSETVFRKGELAVLALQHDVVEQTSGEGQVIVREQDRHFSATRGIARLRPAERCVLADSAEAPTPQEVWSRPVLLFR